MNLHNTNIGAKEVSRIKEIKQGNKVHCGQDMRDLLGMTITDVISDSMDLNVVMQLENEEGRTAVHFDNNCFDGEHMSILEFDDADGSTTLRNVTENDLREFATMTRYYEIEVTNEKGERTGLEHLYCNDIDLEGTDDFVVKSLYVFYDGRILTENK